MSCWFLKNLTCFLAFSTLLLDGSRLMFQPAEEGGAGAKRMEEEGVLKQSPKPQHAFGLHVWPT